MKTTIESFENTPGADGSLGVEERLKMIACGRPEKKPGFSVLTRRFLVSSLRVVSACYGQQRGKWLPLAFVLLSPGSALPAADLPPQKNGTEATETIKQSPKLPPCPTSESERNQVSPYYFNLCAGVHLPKSDASPVADGKSTIPP